MKSTNMITVMTLFAAAVSATSSPAPTVPRYKYPLSTSPPPAPAPAPIEANPFAGKTFYANEIYAKQVESAVSIIAKTDAVLATKAREVAKIGTFLWIDDIASISQISKSLSKVKSEETIGLVVYGLPDRDCSAKASSGEPLEKDGLNRYKTEFIDEVRTQLLTHPSTHIILIIEPDALPNLITNLNVTKCTNAAQAYKSGIQYALEKLSLPNTTIYMDAGHSGWLGWDQYLEPSAKLFAEIYKAAGSPPQVRGLSINVSNYNAYKLHELGAATNSSSSNKPELIPAAANKPSGGGGGARDEASYAEALAPFLKKHGFPPHFIVDTGRNGVQRIRGSSWCNLKGAGFGARPTILETSGVVDAFVWVKPGGQSDGTSNETSLRFDSHCGSNTSQIPAPEAGAWFQEYFVNLVKNANPPL